MTRSIEYTITQSTGDQKFMVALIFKDIFLNYKDDSLEEIENIQIGECALVLVANQPIFQVQKQILDFIYRNVILENINMIIDQKFDEPIPEKNSLEFYLSLIFHHLKMDSSNL